MKSKILSALIAVALCSQAVFITSCSDDDDDNLTPEQREQQQAEKASTFWNIVGKLVNGDDVTDDYQGKTFEPTIGIADETSPTTRIVNTNDMRTAARRFANLVGAKGIDENTENYEWSDPEIGSMTYTKGGDATNWATVDVNIKAVPTLQRIIYRAGGEGDNGSFDGKAYYRFGDVVSRQVNITYDAKKNNDQRGTITEYWICVRPAFGPEGKEDSHWVCVNTVGDKNYKYYKSSTGTEYWLPTSLKSDEDNMQNFAELLWAICRPGEWFDNAFNHHTDGRLWGFTGVPIFTDFTYKHLKYHNKAFWQNVQNGWIKAKVAESALNLPLNILADVINNNGVCLLHKGYSWWFTSSWNCELYEAVYTNGKTAEELNMHHAEYYKWETNMKGLKFDVRTMGQKQDNYNAFFNNDGKYRWAIRHATGKELAGNKKVGVKEAIPNVTEVYRYYRDVLPLDDLSGEPESSELISDKPLLGYLIGENGMFYKNATDVRKGRTTAVAVVVYLGDKFVENNRQDPDMPHYNGLAMSISQVNGMTFSANTTPDGICYYQCDDYSDFYNIRNGLKQMECFDSYKCKTGQHIGGHYNTHNFSTNLQKNSTNFSPWFIPSVGQWILVLREFGYTWDGTSANFGNVAEGYAKWSKTMTDGGVNFLPINHMTCTEKDNTSYHTILLEDDVAKFTSKNKKGDNVHAHAFTAFSYGTGATDDDLLDRY